MKFHKEAFPFVLFPILILVVLIVMMNIFLPQLIWVHIIVYGGSFYVLLYLYLFFKKPGREFTKGEDLVIAPADGKVVVVEEVFDDNYFHETRLQISIFMSPYVPHWNISPTTAVVRQIIYQPGKHIVACNPKSSLLNEQNTLIMEGNGVTYVVRQIAGAVARTIKCYVSTGETINQGHERGFIRL